MAMLSFCGIDVSKDRLDVMVLRGQLSFAVRNDAAGWAELIARLRGFAIVAIGLEASGGCERGAMRAGSHAHWAADGNERTVYILRQVAEIGDDLDWRVLRPRRSRPSLRAQSSNNSRLPDYPALVCGS
jgi:hypothetical protein